MKEQVKEFAFVASWLLILVFALFGMFTWIYLYLDFYPSIVCTGVLFGLLFNEIKEGILLEQGGIALKLLTFLKKRYNAPDEKHS